MKKLLSIVAEFLALTLAGLAGGLLVSARMTYLPWRQASTAAVLMFLGGVVLCAIFLWFSAHHNGHME